MTDKKRSYCSVCGDELELTLERHYISRDSGVTGISVIVRNEEATLYDTFDCPVCGCQNIAQERKRCLIEEKYTEDEEEEDDGEDE